MDTEVVVFKTHNREDGFVRAEIKSTTIIAFRIPHDSAKNYLDNEDLKRAGIYFLVNDKKQTVYIGQADRRVTSDSATLGRMLEQHSNSEIDEWNFGYVLTSSTKHFLTTDALHYLEQLFYVKAKEMKHYKVLNGVEPYPGYEQNIAHEVKVSLKPFIENALYLLDEELKCEVFMTLRDIITPPHGERTGNENPKESAVGKQFFLKTTNTKCTYTGEQKFLLKLGESVRNQDYLSPDKGYGKLREQLIADRIIVDFVFTKDYEFDNPSQAASVILGRMADGNLEWRDENGKPFGDFAEAKHKKDKSVF